MILHAESQEMNGKLTKFLQNIYWIQRNLNTYWHLVLNVIRSYSVDLLIKPMVPPIYYGNNNP